MNISIARKAAAVFVSATLALALVPAGALVALADEETTDTESTDTGTTDTGTTDTESTDTATTAPSLSDFKGSVNSTLTSGGTSSEINNSDANVFVYYKIEPSLAGDYTLTLTSATSTDTVYLFLYDNDGNCETFSGTGSASTIETFAVNSTWYVALVNETSAAKLTFSLSLPDLSNATVSGINESYTYTGLNIEPTVTVKIGDSELTKGTHYEVTCSDNQYVGKAKLVISGKDTYSGSITKTFDITAATNTLAVKAKKTVKVKKKTLNGKLKSNVSVAQSKLLTCDGDGAITFARTSVKCGSKTVKGAQLKKIVVKKGGKVQLKKGLKKGLYKIVLTVSADGKEDGYQNYTTASKSVTVKIKVM